MLQTKAKIRAMRIVLAVGLLIMALKFVAFFLTNSAAILTDALESIINIVAGSFALFSITIAALPKDANHPYGHGKIEFFAQVIEGTLIAVAGIYMSYEAVQRLFEPEALHSLDLGILLIIIGGSANGILGWFLVKNGKKHNSPALVSDGKHLLSDMYTSIALLIGVVAVWATDLLWLDSVTTFILTLILVYTGGQLIRESVGGLMDETDPELLKGLVGTLQNCRRPQWIDIHNLKARRYGGFMHVDCHFTFPCWETFEHVHNEQSEIEKMLEDRYDGRIEIVIHAEPCTPILSCKICTVQNCPVRQAPHQQTIEWSLENTHEDVPHTV